MSSFKESTANHEEIILGILRSAHGDWVSGKHLFDTSGTTDLGARITNLRCQGWTIESHKSDGFFDYRVVGPQGPQPGRKQFIVPVPRSGGRRALTNAEALEAQASLEAHLAEFLEKIMPSEALPKEVDPIDWLLSNILEAK